jgi:hypothetical protein
VQKYNLFPIPQALFSIIFPLSRISLIVNGKNLPEDEKQGFLLTYINIKMRHQRAKTRPRHGLLLASLL